MTRSPALAAAALALLGSFCSALPGCALTLALGLHAVGCAESSPGAPARAGQDADLEVRNRSHNTIHVYLDGSKVGSVDPDAERGFRVVTGSHEVTVRERGHDTRHVLGTFYFGLSNTVKVSYDG